MTDFPLVIRGGEKPPEVFEIRHLAKTRKNQAENQPALARFSPQRCLRSQGPLRSLLDLAGKPESNPTLRESVVALTSLRPFRDSPS